MTEHLRAELAQARQEMKAHLASWEYAFANGGGPNSGRDHPVHERTRARTRELAQRVKDLEARLAEHDL